MKISYRNLSRFGIKKPSSFLKDVIVAVHKLLLQKNGDNEFSAFIHAINSEELENRYLRKQELKYSQIKSWDIIKLLGKNAKYTEEMQPPKADHPSLFSKNGKTYSYVSQPYNGLSFDEIKGQIAYCEKYGYELNVLPGSWHYPGWTILLEYRKKEK